MSTLISYYSKFYKYSPLLLDKSEGLINYKNKELLNIKWSLLTNKRLLYFLLKSSVTYVFI